MERNSKVIIGFLFFLIIILVFALYLSTYKSGKEEVIFNVSTGFFKPLGSGNIEIIEFSDFQCPICGKQEPILKQILEKYDRYIKLYYRNFPLPMHENSFGSALASMCANEQGKFWEYHDLLFENQDKLNLENLKEYAEQLDLNTKDFNSCLDSKKYKQEVEKDFQDGEKLGVGGTPTFFINGRRIEGFRDFQTFKNIIEK